MPSPTATIRLRGTAPLTLAVLGVLAAGLLPPSAADAAGGKRLVTAWAQGLQDPGPAAALVAYHDDVGGRTIRNVIRPTLDGKAVRIRLSNLYGARTVRIDDARIARSAGGAATGDRSRRFRFDGHKRVRIPVGEEVRSDRIPMRVNAGENLAVSLYSARPTGAPTIGGSFFHTNYISAPGNVSDFPGPGVFPRVAKAWYFLDGLDVVPRSRSASAVVAIGDSVVTGYSSTADAYRGWVDVLGRRLRAAKRTRSLALVNAGIAGNNLHADTNCFGESVVHRFRRDVLAQPGVGTVIVAAGGNDLIQPAQDGSNPCKGPSEVGAGRMIDLYGKLIRRAHANGLRILLGTIFPFGDNEVWTPSLERKREKINDWIRSTERPDGVIDIDRVLADPADPEALDPAYDSGDGIHPNDAGHAAIGRSIPLSLFASRR